MKLKYFALALPFAAPALAVAQSHLTVYGIADAGVRHSSGMTASNAPSALSSSSVASGVNNTSRLGFRGREDLGDGTYALFNFESGLNIDTGATANTAKFFDRAAVVGLGGNWGQVTAGRQINLLSDAISPVDAVGMRFASFNPNIVTAALSNHGLGVEYGTSGATSGSYRLDNSLKYTGRFGPVTARAMYSFGENAGHTSAQSSMGGSLAIAKAGWMVSGAYQRFETAGNLKLRAATLGASYQFEKVRLAFNTARSEGDTATTSETVQRVHSVGATWSAMTSVDITAALYKVDRHRTGRSDDGYTRAMLFGEYKLSRRSKLYVELDRTQSRAGYQGALNKDRATGISTGVVHTF